MLLNIRATCAGEISTDLEFTNLHEMRFAPCSPKGSTEMEAVTPPAGTFALLSMFNVEAELERTGGPKSISQV
jgi:hypothetical protein